MERFKVCIVQRASGTINGLPATQEISTMVEVEAEYPAAAVQMAIDGLVACRGVTVTSSFGIRHDNNYSLRSVSLA